MWSDSFQVSLVKLIFLLQATWTFGNRNEKRFAAEITVGGEIRLFHLEKDKHLLIYKITYFFKRFPGRKSV